MALKNRFFLKMTASVISALMALPSFAGRAELDAFLDKDDYVNAEREAVALARSEGGGGIGACINGLLTYRGNFSSKDEATQRKLLYSCVGIELQGTVIYAEFAQAGQGGPADPAAAQSALLWALPLDKHGRVHSAYARWLVPTWDGFARPANRRDLIKYHAELSAQMGNNYAFYAVGDAYTAGWEGKRLGAQSESLRQEAIAWNRRAAAEQNSSEGMIQYLSLSGLGPKLGDAVDVNMKARALGAHHMAGELAYYYYVGQKLPKNLPEARFWAETGAKKDGRWAVYTLGVLTRDGAAGVPANPQRAVELLTRAHQLNAEIAAADLAGMYATGKLIPQDLGKARQWLQAGYAAAPTETVKADYARRLQLFDEIKAQADTWARQQAQQKKMSGEDMFLLGLAAFGVALASQIDWSARDTGNRSRGTTSYSEPFDFDKHQKTVYCNSYGMASGAAFQFGGC